MIRLPRETLEQKAEPKDYSSPGQAENALRALKERRGPQLHRDKYDAQVARRADGLNVGFYLEVYAMHPHRHDPEAEHRMQALVKEYRIFFSAPVELIRKQPRQ